MAALQFLAEMVQSGKPASTLLHNFDPVPQLLKNVRFSSGQTPLETKRVQDAIALAEADLAGKGRLLIRKSGTEPLIRVMAEHEDAGVMERAVEAVVEAVADAVTR
jgi:phosphoglucosamine mutase